jgi:N-acylneuraminate cytidylyltransferase
MKVIVPLQTCSTRVKNKNLRNFIYDKSLFDVKATQLLQTFDPSKIFVSSENLNVKPQVESYGFNFLLRDKVYTGNEIKQPDLIGHILENIPDDGEDIGWAQVTTPLFNDYTNCLSVWEREQYRHDSLMVVRKVNHIISESNTPINFNFGYWHKATQDLNKLYEISWSFFILKRKIINECKYHIGYNPYKYLFSGVNLDIDTEEDFERAKLLYKTIFP